jgi:hypothetical protein
MNGPDKLVCLSLACIYYPMGEDLKVVLLVRALALLTNIRLDYCLLGTFVYYGPKKFITLTPMRHHAVRCTVQPFANEKQTL